MELGLDFVGIAVVAGLAFVHVDGYFFQILISNSNFPPFFTRSVPDLKNGGNFELDITLYEVQMVAAFCA